MIKAKYEAGEKKNGSSETEVEEYPLSQGQAALWFHNKLTPNSIAYNLAGAAAIPEGTDLEALQRAFQLVVKRHPLLRTLFFAQHGEPVQRVYPSIAVDFQVKDASRWDGAEYEVKLAEAIYSPFNLESGPTWRVVVFKNPPLPANKNQKTLHNEHLVLLVMHHIISDLWSMAILMSELAVYYRQETTGKPANLKHLKNTFTDHVLKEQLDLSGPQAEESWKYWQGALAGALPPLNLQADHPRPIESTGRGFAHHMLLNPPLTRKLRALAAEQNVPLYTVLLSAFQTLLHHYTDQNDILVGFSKAGRNPSTARIVGYFVNQMVIRTDFSDDPSFIDLLERIDRTRQASSQHDWYPFPLLVQHLQPERELNRSPLIQAVFSWQQAPSLIPRQSSSEFILRETGQAVDLGGLVMRPVNLPYHVAPFELVMLAADTSDSVAITIEYAADLFDPPTIAHMANRYQTLLESVVDNPGLPVSRLNLLPESERKTLVEAWNATDAPYPSDLCLYQLFEQQVESTPDLIAISSSNDRLTYRQLNQQANQLAHYLQEQGIHPGSRVAVFLDPSTGMIRAILGILKAGGAYLPLDPNNPKERLAFMLADANPDLVITDQELRENLPNVPVKTLIFDIDDAILGTKPQTNPSNDLTPDHPAYIIYTSGSTGQPKAAILAHRGAVNLLADFQRRQAILPGEACSWWTSPSFDVSVYEIFSPLLVGGSLFVIPENIRLDVSGLFEWLKANQIRSAFLPAFFLQDFLTWNQKNPGGSSLHRLLVGVEPISEASLTSIQALLPSLTILNGYGPTETTICSTLYMVKNSSPRQGNTPIGKPVANTQIYLLDRNLQPVPIGLMGEVYIGGVGLAHGYLNRPDLTAQRFIQSPFRLGEHLYRTGDLARYLPDGNLMFIGRADTQIKLHGMRMELGEIEANIIQFPGIKQAVVLLQGQPSGGQHLVAHLTTSQSPPPSPEELRIYLNQRLPASMVPSHFIVLDAFPLTTSGKVDRKLLPVPEILHVTQNTEGQELQTKAEQTLASIWEHVLGVNPIGRNDNFFNLGGDSILSLQVVALAAEAGLRIKPHHIFQALTLAELAALSKPAESSLQSPWPTSAASEIPLTPLQHWFFQQDIPDPHNWNQSLMFIPSRPLNPTHLHSAVSALSQAHDALRLRFKNTTAGWQATLSETVQQIPFEEIDVSNLSEDQRELFIDKQVTAQQAHLNISSGPLLRVVYFHLGKNQPGRLLIVIHHLAVDAFSWRILVGDLERAYLQLESGQPLQFPAKTTAFQTWAKRLAEYAQSADAIMETRFWREMMETCQRAPMDDHVAIGLLNDQQDTKDRKSHVSVSINKTETRALLQQAPLSYGTEVPDLLLTALVRAFQRLTKKEAIWIDLEAHGREDIFSDIDLSRTVGWFTTLYPVCLKLPQDTPLGQSIKIVKEQLHRIPHHGLGYGILRYLTHDPGPGDRLEELPNALVGFNYLGQLSDNRNDCLFSIIQPAMPGTQSNQNAWQPHPIEINAVVYQGELFVDWNCDSRTGVQYPIEQVAKIFIEELHSLIAHCSSVKVAEYTPSDFPGADLSQDQLDAIVELLSRSKTDTSVRDIEAIYPLSPMQQGMIFHSLYTPDSGIYFVQTSITIQGRFDISEFKRAWQSILDHHPILRTSFIWQGLDQVLQVVHRDVKASLILQDWRGTSESEQQEKFDVLLSTERRQGFNLSIAPLLRLYIIQTSDETYTILLNKHHAILDGWSVALLFDEVFRIYASNIHHQPQAITPTKPYQEYITWLQSQDLTVAEAFWRKELENYIPFNVSQMKTSYLPPTGAAQPAEENERLPIDRTKALQELARKHNLTLSSLVQGAWAILLSQRFDRDDVLFGITVSGRSVELRGLLSMIGLFINTLPLRVRLDQNMRLLEWLQSIQSKAIEIQQFDYSPLAQIQNWSNLSRNAALFDTLLVIENYPATIMTDGKLDGIKISSIRSIEQTTYPITLAFIPKKQLELRVLYDPALFDSDYIRNILRLLDDMLEGMLANPNQKLSELYEHINKSGGLAVNRGGKDKTDPLQMTPVEEHPERDIAKKEDLGGQEQNSPHDIALENYLSSQWKKLLNTNNVDINDNFFQLGGDSLKAAICTYQLQNAMQEKIPLTAIFEMPILTDYAQYLDENFPAGVDRLFGRPTTTHKPIEKNTNTAILIPIQPRGSQSPLFCIHPAGGIVFPYYTLSAFLNKDQPLYGIQDPSLYKPKMDLGSIHAMAEHYIGAIKSIQPEGPYNLLGWSAGGVIAYEMAQQLVKQGQRVVHLIIVDTAAPFLESPIRPQHQGDSVLHHIHAWMKSLPSQILKAGSAIKSISTYIRSGLYLLAAASKQDGTFTGEKLNLSTLLGWVGLDTWRALLLHGDTEIANTVSQETSLLLIRMPYVRRILELVRTHRRLVRQYKANSYRGDITLLHAVASASEQKDQTDPTLGWAVLTEGRVEVRTIHANHVGLFTKPHIEDLAQELMGVLNGKP